MNTANLLLLDVANDEIREVTVKSLQDYYDALQCSCFDIARRKIRGKLYDIYCDDEGALKDGAIVSAVNRQGGAMLMGNLIFANHDRAGNTTSLSKADKAHILNNIGYAMPMSGKPYLILLNCEY